MDVHSYNVDDGPELGKTPISADYKCGTPIRYEAEFEELESEIVKQDALSGGKTDWIKVKNIGKHILELQSKDLLVASYYSQALLLTSDYKGFATGLKIIDDLIGHYWEDMFPPAKRMRARGSALQWLSEKAGVILESKQVSPDNAPYVLASYKHLKSILNNLEDKMPEAPAMLELSRPMKEHNNFAAEHYTPPDDSSGHHPEDDESNSPPQNTQIETPLASPATYSSNTQNPTETTIEVAPTAAAKVNSNSEADQNRRLDHPFSNIGKTPISGDHPAGTDIKNASSFESLEAELSKQESLAAETTDWKIVCRLGAEIIEKQSKDLLVSAYLTKGLLETEGYTGLAVGLQIINDIIECYWDDLYPPLKRIRARNAAMQWLAEKVGHIIESSEPKPADANAVLVANELLNSIGLLLDEKSGGSAPALLEIKRPLKNYRRAAEDHLKPKKSAASTEIAPATAMPESAPVKTSQAAEKTSSKATGPAKDLTSKLDNSTAPASENDAKSALRKIQEANRSVAGFLLNTSLQDPRSYRLNRIACWIMIEAAPPATDGKTQLQPPSADKVKQIHTFISAANHSELLKSIEPTLARAPFWLNGQRIVAEALAALGPDYDAARNVVTLELRNLLTRVPGITQLAFITGEPFADDQTLLWINNEVLASSGDNHYSNNSSAEYSEALAAAQTLLASKKLDEALEIFDQGILSANGEKDKFEWKLSLVELLKLSGKTEACCTVLTALEQDVDRMDLITWDPELASQVFERLYDCYTKLASATKNKQKFLDQAEFALAKLCTVSPIQAVKIKEKQNG
jgi:type VI secretion system protein VasJ